MAYLFVIIGVLARLIPHPVNFAPILAMALFGGTYLNKKTALWVPLLALIISDFFLGTYSPVLMLFVYASTLASGLLGLWLRNHKNLGNIVGTSLLSAVIFYLLSNFGVWMMPSGYIHNWAGLVECYVLALPFFKNTVASNLIYTAVFFGAYELAQSFLRKRKFATTVKL
ncbi:MAG: hypothetical protein A2145_05765 [candidate division Zixibacteria bacterium RBG_16_40_9]|nr:MAG: hypothetical protein A2145_05765 [candidate division Zixibacteria bacterium RBG_16_40_9]